MVSFFVIFGVLALVLGGVCSLVLFGPIYGLVLFALLALVLGTIYGVMVNIGERRFRK